MSAPILRAPTSASNIHRRNHCPGSEAAEEPFAEKDSEWSSEGSLLHSAFFNPESTAVLTVDQQEFVADAERLARSFFETFVNAHGISDDFAFVDTREIALAVHDADGNELIPGHADLVRTWPAIGKAALVDAKFGYKAVEEAAENLQLATYACAVFQSSKSPLTAVGVAIVSPRAFGPRLTSAVYGAEAIDLAVAELKRILDETKKPDAPRHAGEWCLYCRAKPTCPAFLETLGQIELLKTHAIATANNDQLSRLKQACQFAIQVLPDVNVELLKRIDEDRMPGWKARNTGNTRELFDATGAFQRLNEWLAAEGYGKMTASAFDSCRKMVFGSVEDLFYGITGMSKKAAKEKLKDVLSPFVVETPNAKAPVLEK